MKLVFFQWNAFMQQGIEGAMKRLGIEYVVYEHIFSDWDQEAGFVDKFMEFLKDGGYDTVFSVNFAPLIADACEKLHIRYVSWVYDCPLHIRRSSTMKNQCNEIYLFDQVQVDTYKAQGITTVHHLPLSVDSSVFGAAVFPENVSYDCDVSLVGQLYQTDYAYLCSPLDEYSKGYLEGCIHTQMKLSGGYILREMMTDSLIERLNDQYHKASKGTFSVEKAELEYLLACEATGRNRLMALALLQNRCHVNLYSKDTSAQLDKIHHKGYVDYYTQMPQVFRRSKINLNSSLCAIQSGIPLRVLDIMGSGGFVISNFQQELLDYFVPGEDIVIYEDLQDLVFKVQYYLEYEEERIAIARRGYEKVQEVFTFDERIQHMLMK